MNALHSTDFADDARCSLQEASPILGEPADRRRIARIDEGRHADRVIGASAAWRDVLKRATLVAATETTVCLHGESGTGKEVVARYIHNMSPRRRGPFVAINCAALPEQLLESELFGFERGAFTGAQMAKPGLVELAAGGVLFLDEITEMTPAAQAKFLRVLQEREFLRLGGTRPIRTNVRIIVATNQDLHDAVAGGRFSADLYYRVNVFDIRIPPLRDRRDDIPLLAARFLSELGDAMGGQPAELMPDAMDALVKYQWPGNVRELRNTIERLLILASGPRLTVSDVERLVGEGATHGGGMGGLEESATFEEFKLAAERAFLLAKLRQHDWNVAETARALEMPRSNLYKKIERHQLAREQE